MDDGTPLCLAVTIDRRDGSAVFDFEGAGLVGAVCPDLVDLQGSCRQASMLPSCLVRCGPLLFAQSWRLEAWFGAWESQPERRLSTHPTPPTHPPQTCAGTGPQVFGNTNAPPAVTHSAIIYSLRCMVSRDIPLNHGCMKPITVCIPPGARPPLPAFLVHCPGLTSLLIPLYAAWSR
jgi:hypothetical protein